MVWPWSGAHMRIDCGEDGVDALQRLHVDIGMKLENRPPAGLQHGMQLS